MFLSTSYATIIIMIAISFSRSNQKPINLPVGQGLVINNHCGISPIDSETLSHIKATVDYIASKTNNEAACPTGWVLHGKSCYIVIDIPTLEWSAARRNCQKLGGDLPKITTNAENQFIFNLISNQTTTTRLGAWLGYHRKADDKFYWLDDTPLTGYTPWAIGEPNNPTKERCGNMFGPKSSAKGLWNDVFCNLDKTFTGTLTVPVATTPVILCQKTAN